MALTFAEIQEKIKNNQWFNQQEKEKLTEFGSFLLRNILDTLDSGIRQDDPDGAQLIQEINNDGYAQNIIEVLDAKDEASYNNQKKTLDRINEMLHEKSLDSGKTVYEILMDQMNFSSVEERKQKFDIPLSMLNNMLNLNINLTDLEADYNKKHNINDPDAAQKDLNDAINLGAPVNNVIVNAFDAPLPNMGAPGFNMGAPMGVEVAPGIGGQENAGNPANYEVHAGEGIEQMGDDAPPIIQVDNNNINNNINNLNNDPNVININEVDNANQPQQFSDDVKKGYSTYFYLNEYGEGLNGLAKELEDIKKNLKEKGQSNPDANFGKPDAEGGSKYRKMTESLEAAIKAINDRTTKPDVVRKALSTLYKDSLDYYNSHCGLLWKPRKGTKGRERLDMSDKLSDILPSMINLHDTLRNGVSYTASEGGKVHGNTSYNTVEKDMNQFCEQFDILEKGPAIKAQTNIERDKYLYDQLKQRSDNQVKLRNKIKKMSKTFVKKYDYTKGPDFYLTIKKGMSISDKAKYVTLRKYMNQAYRPAGTVEESLEALNSFNPESVKKEYEALAKNPLFIDCMKKNPKDGFSKWEKIEKDTDKIISDYKAELDQISGRPMDALSNKFKHIWYDKNGRAGDYSTEAQMYNKLGRVIALQIITSPQSRNLGRAIAIEGTHEFDAFAENVSKYIEQRNVLDRYVGSNKMDGIRRCLQDTQLSAELLKDYNIKKQAQLRNRQPAVQKQANHNMQPV